MGKNSEKNHQTESLSKGIQSKDEATTQDWRTRRDAAIRRYHELGLCPIPLRGKAPYHKGWQIAEKYQELSTEEVLRAFQPNDNVGLLCGIQMQDGRYLMGIDYDDLTMWDEHAANQEIKWLTQGSIVKTGSGKFHHYVLSDCPNKFVFGGRSDPSHGGEVQGVGTQCVAPPSIHPDTGKEYLWGQEDWDNLAFVPDSLLKYHYPPAKEKKKFAGGSTAKTDKKNSGSFGSTPAEEKTIYKAMEPTGPGGYEKVYYDYSTIDFIALFRERGEVIQDNGDSVYVLCPNRAQHTKNTDGTSSTVILRTDSGGQRFKCLHGHCEHLSDRDQLVKLLGGDDVLKGYAKERQAGSSYIIEEADPDLQRRMDEEFQDPFPSELLPLPATDPPPPKLDANLLPEPLASYCSSAAIENETTPEAIAGFLLAALGVMTGTRLLVAPDRFQKPNWFESAIRSTALVMDVSAGKTGAFRMGLRPLEALQKKYRSKHKSALIDYEKQSEPLVAQRKGLLKKLASTSLDEDQREEITEKLQNLSLPEKPTETVLLMNRATQEKILQMAANGNERGMLLKADELVGLIDQTNRHGNEGLREFYIEAMTVAREVSSHTISRGTDSASTLALSLAGCVQPGKLQRLLRDMEAGYKDDGLLQRFLWIIPTQPKFSEFDNVEGGFRASTLEPYNEVRNLFERIDQMEPVEFGAIETDYSPSPFCFFDNEAYHEWREWRRELRGNLIVEPDISDGFRGWLGKSERLVSGLSLTFHVVECAEKRKDPGPIGISELARAIDFWEIARHHARRVFSLSATTSREVMTLLLKKFPSLAPEFSIRDVKRKCWSGLRDDATILDACEWLCDLGYLVEIAPPRLQRGRPGSPRFKINPQALEKK